MIQRPIYEVNLYLDGVLIGDCRVIAENLNYTRRRTRFGSDSIDFNLNDVVFDEWLSQRNYTLTEVLRPMALECQLTRNGIDIVGGFLATMPSYSPLQSSATLAMHFDGYLNLLAGVYIRDTSTNLPLGSVSGSASTIIEDLITLANRISGDAGKSYGLSSGTIEVLPSITQEFDNYKTVKEWICERCDNISGAGPFEVYFHADKTYDIIADSNFGTVISDWVAYYPTILNGASVTTIQASETEGFASAIIGLGAGDVSSVAEENTAIFQFSQNATSVSDYGYFETLYQDSSISTPSVLLNNMNAKLKISSDPEWRPEITLHGKQVSPMPYGNNKIWVGDTITIQNSIDLTGMTNGQFRVNELKVDIGTGGDETISPTLERVVLNGRKSPSDES
jgi:hypothetical protein